MSGQPIFTSIETGTALPSERLPRAPAAVPLPADRRYNHEGACRRATAEIAQCAENGCPAYGRTQLRRRAPGAVAPTINPSPRSNDFAHRAGDVARRPRLAAPLPSRAKDVLRAHPYDRERGTSPAPAVSRR